MDPDLLQRIHRRNEAYKRDQAERAMAAHAWTKEQWYHGRIDRATTDTILAGKRPGLFLVRDSSTCPGDFVLSVSENNKVSHYIISRRGQLYLIGDQTFSDLPSVIEFYTKHFLDTTTLREHAPRMGTTQHAPPPMGLHQVGGAPGPMMPHPAAPQPAPQTVAGKLIVKGKFDFRSEDPEDLHFNKGDVMTVLRKDEDEWWFARHSDGREGSIPVPYLLVVEEQTQPFFARATMDRDCPYDPTALSFRAGDIIRVTKQNENGMWEGEINNKRGHFPFKLVEVVDSANHQ
jgi:proto-oncogene C-crk